MTSRGRKERIVRDYVLSQSHAAVSQIDFLSTQHVLGEPFDIWDVQTADDRWWVISNPTNLYRQADFLRADVAFTFHLGLRTRLIEGREPAPPALQERFRPAWRKWERGSANFNVAEEAEDYQAVGARCREALLAFVKAVASPGMVPATGVAPKAADFIGWSEIIANHLAPGSSGDRVRGHLERVRQDDLGTRLVADARGATRPSSTARWPSGRLPT